MVNSIDQKLVDRSNIMSIFNDDWTVNLKTCAKEYDSLSGKYLKELLDEKLESVERHIEHHQERLAYDGSELAKCLSEKNKIKYILNSIETDEKEDD